MREEGMGEQEARTPRVGPSEISPKLGSASTSRVGGCGGTICFRTSATAHGFFGGAPDSLRSRLLRLRSAWERTPRFLA